ncbi:hypothetical protein ES288_D08G112300v1 [Gossypium darwinii]|uniref:PB1-like domain-containing protein n=1 Tax=Gossypium darwinii TaxID=34276 RepID=A0A5D2BLJ1_GOSDA|nr:hypothetical protein ES288_D08G112300v1 [Gossypium darwinii]
MYLANMPYSFTNYFPTIPCNSKFKSTVINHNLQYLGGVVVRLKEGPDTISYFELCKIVKHKLGFNTVQLIYFHVPGSRTLQDNLRVM